MCVGESIEAEGFVIAALHRSVHSLLGHALLDVLAVLLLLCDLLIKANLAQLL